MKQTYQVTSKLWLYPGESANWHFLTVPKDVSTDLKEKYRPFLKGFGSLPVEVTIGETTWKTSIFPDRRTGTYFLPVKAKVRKREDLLVDDEVEFSFRISTG